MPDLSTLHKVLGTGLMYVAVAFLVVVIFVFVSVRVGHVTGEQTGVMLNRLTGKITVVEQSGARIYNGLTTDFYVLDKTLQTLSMSGGRDGDSLKVKTIDGSDVYVDLKVQYRMEPVLAEAVITTSGPEDAFKEKWARDYCRSICRNYLGELTTEEFYNASARDAKVMLAKKDINELLTDFGIVIDSVVIPQRPQFYKEYEEMIKKKKLADQEVLEEQSKALAAQQRQETEIVSATNQKNVAIEKKRGEMEQLIIDAEAKAEQMRKAAEAYHARVTIGAEATYYQKQKEADGILALKRAEAEGIEALKKALEGEGGRNMVKYEYAKKLKDILISGQPFIIEGRTERFQHTTGAASEGRKASGK
jgi:regulator of protease activity HflC (stomatin/prohibitin superfamily)